MTTITYNIGGTLYDFPADIIGKHPDSMLARIAEKWTTPASERAPGATTQQLTETTFFINGSGSRFKYVIEYLSNGKVQLPKGVSKGAVLDDLEYYGIDIGEGNVFEYHRNVLNTILGNLKERDRMLEESAAKLELAASSHYFLHICQHIHQKILSGYKNGGIQFLSPFFEAPFVHFTQTLQYSSNEHHAAFKLLLPKHKCLFQACMREYGLVCTNLRKIKLDGTGILFKIMQEE